MVVDRPLRVLGWSSGVENVTRVAAFDCGTNSLRLLVADLDLAAGTSKDVVREMRIVRLGQGVDRTGRIAEASLQRVFVAVEEYMEEVRGLDVDQIRFCATSAARDAENADDFVAGIRDRVGVQPEVLVGDDEARTSFAGAVRDLPPLPEPLMVVDIGGGSTELILGTGDGAVEAAHSLDIGSVRLNERHLHTDPPTKDEIREAVVDIDAALDTSTVDLGRAASVIGVAGTVTTIAAGVLGLEHYEPELIHRSVLRLDAVQGQVTQLLSMMVEQRKALGYMHPGRADVIGAGGLILDRVLRRTTVGSLLVSEHDILDGIAWSMVGR
jgi:exopolyphosphatase/guanosine-5'-triphosphate,3'-diphosphate pyrophosphatase